MTVVCTYSSLYYANYDNFECHALSKKATSIYQPARFGPKVTVIMRFHCI